MTVRESLADLKLSMFLAAVALVGLGVDPYFTYAAGPPGSTSFHCVAFRATGFFCGQNYVAYWWVGAVFTVICSIWASGLAVWEGLDSYPEEKRVDYSVAAACLLPIVALATMSIAAS
jgi:hypothetical protein